MTNKNTVQQLIVRPN